MDAVGFDAAASTAPELPAAVRVCLGQVLAFLMSCTGLFSSLLVDSGISFPLLQVLASYLAIATVFAPTLWALRRSGRVPPLYCHPSAAPGSVPCVARAWTHVVAAARALWPYAAIAVVDLEANYLVVLAYRYTDMTSVQLLDCFTVPCVMLFSFLAMGVRVTVVQLVGAAIAMAGLACLIVFDVDGLARTGDRPNALLGDLLCLASSVLYALSNVACERLLKTKRDASPSGDACRQGAADGDREADQCSATEGRAAACQSTAIIDDSVRCGAPMPTVLLAVSGGKASRGYAALESTSSPSSPQTYAAPPTDGKGSKTWSAVLRSQLEAGAAPAVTYLALMPAFGSVFAAMQFAALEAGSVAAHSGSWKTEQALYLLLFAASMVVVYGAMPLLFLLSSATFANLSLLTADVYSIAWNASVFGVRPRPLFAVPFAATLGGIAVYDTNGFAEWRAARRAAAVPTRSNDDFVNV